MIQSFLKWDIFWNICSIPLRDMGYFSKYLKEYGIPGTPLPGPHYGANAKAKTKRPPLCSGVGTLVTNDQCIRH